VVRAAEEPSDQLLFQMPAFKLVDQDGNAFTDESLRGKVWIGSFVFTRCAGPCPIIMSKLAGLQEKLPEQNIKLVSFTVDPEFDTPAILKQRADEMHAEPGKWTFVTGEKSAVEETLHEMLQPNPEQGKDEPLMHDTHLFLFDAQGKCHKRYSIDDADEMNQLVTDAKAMAGGSAGQEAPR
jgi:cytochrome oxidase Cu insertion factor (SCO1/SenC/PrrC family)